MSRLVFIENKTGHNYHLKGYKIRPYSTTVADLSYSANHSTHYKIHGHDTLKFKLTKNGLLDDLSKGLNYGCNNQYLPLTRTLGSGRCTLWVERQTVPAFYQSRTHLVILDGKAPCCSDNYISYPDVNNFNDYYN